MNAPLSKRAMKHARRAAARSGAILLPGETASIPEWQRRQFAEDDRKFAEAIERLKASEARTRAWIAEVDARS